MGQIALKADRVLTPTKELTDVAIIVEKDIIKKIIPSNEIPQNMDVLYHPNTIAAPGFIDIHIHGYHGCDSTSGKESCFAQMSKSLLKHGVTSYLPTTVTQSQEVLLKICNVLKSVIKRGVNGAEILGLHLEGPYIGKGKEVGAQNVDFARNPDIKELMELIENSGNNIRRITLAPELPGALELIKYVKEKGIIVAAGHTNATYKEAILGFNAGVTICNHLFNGMRPFHHREPGIVGAYFVRDDLYAEMIADMIHLHPEVINAIIKMKGTEKIILITDAIAGTCLPDGEYELGGLRTIIKDGISRIETTGRLAGSTLRMDVAIKNIVTNLGVDLKDAIRMATSNPAEAMKLSNYGRLAPGCVADIVVLDSNLDVLITMCRGKVLYSTK
ncbi:MAG: N-acetylglucosamine-6-phosphate deacetylase [Candidatus Heimdallarchaeota archaeon]|nr:MAG: N-acetylglucosamine-6-phosphate deacetylase [Candidatus Heimdallarchaeota archaeon]